MDENAAAATQELLQILRRIDAKLDQLLAEKTRGQDQDVWEEQCLAAGEADMAAGRVVSWEKIEAWLDTRGTDHELPGSSSGQWRSVPRCLLVIRGAAADVKEIAL